MRNKYLYILLFVFLMGAFTSCNESDKNDGIDFLVNDGTKAEAFAGDWYVTFQIKGQPTPYGVYKINTFNTSENEKNVFWIKEDFQVKAKGDGSLGFALLDGEDIAGNSNLTSLTGKIFPKLGHSKTGNVTDSIYMEFVYEGDTDIYTIKGHKRTRWPEDDY